MRGLPFGWARAPFTEVIESLSTLGRVVEAKEYSPTGSIPVLTQGTADLDGLTDDTSRVFMTSKELIIFGDHTRAVKIAEPPFAVGPNTKVLLPGPALTSKFLFYQLPLIVPPSRGYGRHFQFLKKADVVVAPIEEQKRIVAAIEEQFSRLDAGAEALGRARQNLKHMRSSVLEAAVTGRLTAHDPSDGSGTDLLKAILSARDKYLAGHPYSGSKRRPSAPDDPALKSLPNGWTWASIDQLSTRVSDGVHKKPNYVSEGIPFVTVRNLTAGPGISFNNLNYITPEDHAEFCQRSRLEFGDLLVSKDGTLGVVRAVRDRRDFSIFVSVALIKPVLSEMTDYLEIALSSPTVQRQMVPKGTGLQHIHLEDLRADCIPLPSLAEQKRIVMAAQSELSRLDHLEEVIERQAVRAKTLRSSILDAAFAGRLAPQNPSDESASALLEGVAANRTSNGHKVARGRKFRTSSGKVTA